MVLKNNQKENSGKISKILTFLGYFVVLVFALLAMSSKFSIGGFKLLVVKTGSMEPAIKTGSMVIDKSAGDYAVGDIITFKHRDNPAETTTHRIADKKCQGSSCTFTTKGDANDGADSEKITQDRIVGKVEVSVPYFGYVVNLARTLPGLIIVIIIPATIIIYEEIKKIHHETKQIVHRRRRKKEGRSDLVEDVTLETKSENLQPLKPRKRW